MDEALNSQRVSCGSWAGLSGLDSRPLSTFLNIIFFPTAFVWVPSTNRIFASV